MIQIRVSQEQHDLITAEAKRYGMPRTIFLRFLILKSMRDTKND